MEKVDVKKWLAQNGFKPAPKDEDMTRNGVTVRFMKTYITVDVNGVWCTAEYEELFTNQYGQNNRGYEYLGVRNWIILGE